MFGFLNIKNLKNFSGNLLFYCSLFLKCSRSTHEIIVTEPGSCFFFLHSCSIQANNGEMWENICNTITSIYVFYVLKQSGLIKLNRNQLTNCTKNSCVVYLVQLEFAVTLHYIKKQIKIKNWDLYFLVCDSQIYHANMQVSGLLLYKYQLLITTLHRFAICNEIKVSAPLKTDGARGAAEKLGTSFVTRHISTSKEINIFSCFCWWEVGHKHCSVVRVFTNRFFSFRNDVFS